MANITFTEGSGLQDSIFGKSQEPIKMFLEKRGEAFEQTSMLPELFNMGSSNHWGEKFSTMTAMDGFQPVGENGDYPVDGMQEGFAKFLEHMTWKNSFSLSREIVEDAKLMEAARWLHHQLLPHPREVRRCHHRRGYPEEDGDHLLRQDL